MSDAPTPNWRDSDPQASEPAGTRPWQPNEAAGADPSSGPSKRGIKRMVALLALVGIAVGLGVAIVLLRPLKPACLVLIGSGYEANLLLPHNVHGWNGLSILEKEVAERDDADLARMPWDQPTKVRRVGERIEAKDQTWKEIWDKVNISSYKEKTVVLFISLHGMADKDDAYLLPNSAKKQSVEAFKKSRIRFSEVLDSLEAVKNKKVVLLLDVCHVQSHWPIGLLHNDFVKRLQEKYEAKIKEMGNVTVICSTSADQRSWASDELQTSIFAHYVTQALKGAGQEGSGRVTALRLFKYVEEKVDKWAQTNRARNQTPVMLGAESVADKIELVHVAGDYTPPELPARAFDPESLRTEWARWKELKKDHIPQVHSPHVWRLYQDMLLRYEQLARAGDPTSKVPDLKQQLEKLYADLSSARSLDKAFASLGNSFPMPQVLGYRPTSQDMGDAELQKLVTNLRKADSDDERNKVLARYREKSPQERQYLQARVSQLILKEAVLAGRFDRTGEQENLTAIERELRAPQRAAEVHLVKMLRDADPSLDHGTIKLALRVRMEAEEVALSAMPDNRSAELYADVIFPWIQSEVMKADDLRRAGEDLLFGDPTTHGKEAGVKLKKAQSQYDEVRNQAKKLQAALALRDEVSADLPYLAAWLATLPPLRNANKEKINEQRQDAEQVGDALALLKKQLDEKKLPGGIAQFDKDFKRIRESYQDFCVELKKKQAVLQQNWHALDSALSIPPMGINDEDVTLRLTLLTNLRRLSGDLQRGNDLEGKAEAEDAPKVRVERQRTLLRASLKSFEDIEGDDKDSVDGKVRDFFLGLPAKIIEKADGAVGDEPDLNLAANLCRAIPGGLVEQVKSEKSERINPVERLRRLGTYRLLHGLARRTLEDHWFEPGPAGDTFYVPAGKAYLDSARGLFDQGMMSDALLKKAGDLQDKFVNAGLTISQKPDRHWTSEGKFPLAWHVQAATAVPPGTPMVWLEVKKGNKAEKLWQPEARKPISVWPTKEKPYADVFPLNKVNLGNAGDVKVFFHAVYRGQHLTEDLTFLQSEPNLIVRHFPAPKNSGFAVRMDSGFNYGAISIVLDNSGSMKWVYPSDPKKPMQAAVRQEGQKRRFDFALAALGNVLGKVPNNTSLSIYTLGSKNVTDVTEYWAPKPWRQEKYLQNLLLDLDDAPGNIESPIAEAIIKSMKDGFPASLKDPKVILVLTDGDDNKSFGGNASVEKIRKELMAAHIAYPDVRVVMVCFIQKDDEEHERSKAQFDGLPFIEWRVVPEGEKLGITIEDLIRPRIQLTLEGKPVSGFQGGQPVSYAQDKALHWKSVSANTYRAKIMKTLPKDIGVELSPGRNIFAVLKREDKNLYLERGVLGRQPEIIKLEEPKEKEGWLVSLLENHKNFDHKLSHVLAFEKAEIEKGSIQENFLRQTHPGFTWLELDAVDGPRSKKTLVWGKEHSVPAASFRLEMPDWMPRQSKVTAWFWPEERDHLLSLDKLVTRVTISTDPKKPLIVKGKVAGDRVIESALWEDQMVKDAAGNLVNERCLVVRVRHAPGRPVWVDLDRERSEIGSEHHYFSFADAGKTTIYFYRLAEEREVDLVLLDVEAFKKAAQKVEFTPEQQYRVPTMFFNKLD